MTEKLKAKALKLPKSLGACVDKYHQFRQQRLLEQKEVDELKKTEKAIQEHIIDNLDKRDEGGAVGREYKGVVKTETQYIVEDWDKFYAHIKKTGEFDLLNRALNQAAVKERVAMQDPPKRNADKWRPKLPPGVGRFTVKKLSVTKV